MGQTRVKLHLTRQDHTVQSTEGGSTQKHSVMQPVRWEHPCHASCPAPWGIFPRGHNDASIRARAIWSGLLLQLRGVFKFATDGVNLGISETACFSSVEPKIEQIIPGVLRSESCDKGHQF